MHTHDYKANALARLMWPVGGYRIVATVHGYNRTTRRETCYYTMEKLLLRSVDAIICPSRQLAAELAKSGISRNRLHVIGNGIALEDWPFTARRRRLDGMRVLYAGRLSPEKNIPALLEAAALLSNQGRELTLQIAGEGPQQAVLELRARELRIDHLTTWLGLREDVPALMARADVFVNPSLTEGMPNTVLEAMASGLPVVATDVGATSDLVNHEQTGLLVPAGDVEALAQAIARLYDWPDLGQLMSQRARRRVEENHSLLSRTAHVVALYRGVLAAARRTA